MQITPNSAKPLSIPWSEQLGTGEHPSEEYPDNRASPRFLVQRRGMLRIVKSPPAIERFSVENTARKTATVQIRDLSRSGIGWVYPVQLFPKESVEIRLEQFLITAQVARCRRLSSGDFEVGGIITSVQTADK